MKKKYLILFFAVVFVLYGCNSNRDKEDSNEIAENKLRSAIQDAEKSETIIDTIFLGFRFGMSEKETKQHLKQLVASKKLRISDEGYYIYDLETTLGGIRTKLGADHCNGELYRITLKLEDLNGDIDNPQLLMYKANDVFKIKADAEGFMRYLTKDVEGKHEINYIKSNLVVQFSSLVNATIRYTNAPMLELVKRNEEDRVLKSASDL